MMYSSHTLHVVSDDVKKGIGNSLLIFSDFNLPLVKHYRRY